MAETKRTHKRQLCEHYAVIEQIVEGEQRLEFVLGECFPTSAKALTALKRAIRLGEVPAGEYATARITWRGKITREESTSPHTYHRVTVD